jgi:hypothetical protein
MKIETGCSWPALIFTSRMVTVIGARIRIVALIWSDFGIITAVISFMVMILRK